MKNLKLESFGVQELDANSLVAIQGGSLPSWLKKAGVVGLAMWLMDNWADIKGGLSDGVKADQYH